MRDLRQQVRTTPPLQAGEQERLLARIALGDRASQDRLVATNLAMVIRMAEARRERGLSVSDLVLEGSLGFLDAMNTFVQSESVDFIAFAERKVGDQMHTAIASATSVTPFASRRACSAYRTCDVFASPAHPAGNFCKAWSPMTSPLSTMVRPSTTSCATRRAGSSMTWWCTADARASSSSSTRRIAKGT